MAADDKTNIEFYNWIVFELVNATDSIRFCRMLLADKKLPGEQEKRGERQKVRDGKEN